MNLFSLLYLEFLKFLFLSFCILLVIPASVVPVHLPRFSISKIPLVFFFIAYIQSLSSKLFELFVDFFFLVLWFTLRDLLISYNFLFAFFSLSLREFFISSLRASIIFIKLF